MCWERDKEREKMPKRKEGGNEATKNDARKRQNL